MAFRNINWPPMLSHRMWGAWIGGSLSGHASGDGQSFLFATLVALLGFAGAAGGSVAVLYLVNKVRYLIYVVRIGHRIALKREE